MNIILAGYIALEATHKLITNEKPALSCRFSDRFLRQTDEMTSFLFVNRDSIEKVISDFFCESKRSNNIEYTELSEYGILAGLWDYAESKGCGLSINLESISIRQETIEIFEQLNVNPYSYPSNGSWLIGCEYAHELVDYLNENGIVAAVIGKEIDSKDRTVVNQDEVRFLTPVDRLLKDEQGLKNLR